jgi:bacillithiol biosynthesis cysteine-adding enzyme BshC
VPLEAGTSATRLPIDIRQLPWINRLASDYARDFERLAPFYRGSPAHAADWTAAIERAQRHARPRSEVAAILHAQQARRGAPAEARSAAAQVADARTVAVVTGQQAGVFGGPLFTLLKALSAIALAEHVRTTYRIPAVAVFWVDAEDHDWDEVRSCGVLDAELARQSVTVPDVPGAHQEAVGRLRFDDQIGAAIDALFTAMPATEFSADVRERLQHAYHTGAGVAEAFAGWMESLFGSRGLIVFDSSDPAAKPLVAELLAREVEFAGATVAAATAAGAELAGRGYHAQVSASPGSLALFSLKNGRQPMRAQDDSVVVGDQAEPRAAVAARVRHSPADFAPNVLLRPLVQDTLFPTVCYVAGPSELAYLGQLRSVYEAFGIPMPLVHPRASATIVDGNAWRFLNRPDVTFAALKAQDESALNALLEASLPPSVDAAFDDAQRALASQMDRVTAEMGRVDATLAGAAQSVAGRMHDDLQKLRGKVVQAAKRKDDVLRRQFRHAQAQAFPSGRPQEREVGGVYFLNKYGVSLIERLAADLPPDIGTHWVLTV